MSKSQKIKTVLVIFFIVYFVYPFNAVGQTLIGFSSDIPIRSYSLSGNVILEETGLLYLYDFVNSKIILKDNYLQKKEQVFNFLIQENHNFFISLDRDTRTKYSYWKLDINKLLFIDLDKKIKIKLLISTEHQFLYATDANQIYRIEIVSPQKWKITSIKEKINKTSIISILYINKGLYVFYDNGLIQSSY